MDTNIIALKTKLDTSQMAILASEMEKAKKSTGLAYVLWFFLGTLGIHKFYIGKIGGGVAYLILGALGWILGVGGLVGASVSVTDAGAGAGTTSMIFGFIAFGVVGVLLLIDLFSIPGQLRKAYDKKELFIIQNLIGNSAHVSTTSLVQETVTATSTESETTLAE